MKKLILASSILFIIGTTGATAQESLKPSTEEIQKDYKKKVIEDLKITSSQFDKVDKVLKEIEKISSSLDFSKFTEEQISSKVYELKKKLMTRLKEEIKDDILADKIYKYFTEMAEASEKKG